MHLAAITYDKLVVYADGTFELTNAPLCIIFGFAPFSWYVIGAKCAVAAVGDKRAPVNTYWEQVKPAPWANHRLRGCVVFFRHYAHFTLATLAATSELRANSNFSLPSYQINTEPWQKPW